MTSPSSPSALTLLVVVQQRSVHEHTVACAAVAAAQARTVNPLGHGTFEVRRDDTAWIEQAGATEVRVAPLRHIQRLVMRLRNQGVPYAAAYLGRSRVLVAAPSAEHPAHSAHSVRLRPLVEDLRRDATAYYREAVDRVAILGRPPMTMAVSETASSRDAIAAAAAVTFHAAGHAQIEAVHTTGRDVAREWKRQGHRLAVTFHSAPSLEASTGHTATFTRTTASGDRELLVALGGIDTVSV